MLSLKFAKIIVAKGDNMKKKLEHYSEIIGLSDYDEWSYCAQDDMWYEDAKEPLPKPDDFSEYVRDLSCELKVGYSALDRDDSQIIENDEVDGDGKPLEEFPKHLLGMNDYYVSISSVILLKTPRNILNLFIFNQKYALNFDEYSMWYFETFIEKLKTKSYATQYIEDYGYIKLIAWTNKRNRTRFAIYSYADESYSKIFDITINRDLLVNKFSTALQEWKETVYKAIKEQEKILNKKVVNPPLNTAIKHFFPDLFSK